MRVVNLENNNRKITKSVGNFHVLEYIQDASVSPMNAIDEYFMSKMNVRRRQVVIDIDRDHSAVIQAGAMQWMGGNVQATSGVKGIGDLFGKAIKGAVTKETAVKPEYVGEGILVLEPTYKYIILQDVSMWGVNGMTIEDGKVHVRSGASCIGQGLGTVLEQVVCEALGVTGDRVVYVAAETNLAPDSGTTSGSRQTLVTGEAARRACMDILEDLKGGKTLEDLNGKEYYGEYLAATDPMGCGKKNPVSHVAYGYATQVVCLNEDGTIEKVVAAHDVGKAITPLSVEGQIEGGVLMGLGYALTEDFPLKNGVPQAKYGTLGLMRSTQIPDIHAIYVEKEELLPFAYGAKGIGEIATIPTAPAAQGAYYAKDHILRTALPMDDTYYSKKR